RVPIILKSDQHDSVSLVDNTQRRFRDGDALAEIEGTITAGELDLLALLINRGLQQHLKGVGGQHDRRVLTPCRARSIEQLDGEGQRLDGGLDVLLRFSRDHPSPPNQSARTCLISAAMSSRCT